MKLVEKVLLNKLKKDPVKVRQMVSAMDTLDLKTKSQILALTLVYDKEDEHELRKSLSAAKKIR